MTTPYANGASLSGASGIAIAPAERKTLQLGESRGFVVAAATAVSAPLSAVVAPLGPDGGFYPSGIHEAVAVATGAVASGGKAGLVSFPTAPGSQFGVALTNAGAATHIFNINVL